MDEKRRIKELKMQIWNEMLTNLLYLNACLTARKNSTVNQIMNDFNNHIIIHHVCISYSIC